MATSLDYLFAYPGNIHDLDDISYIWHPCCEFLLPNPNVYELYQEYNQLFFKRMLEYRIDIEWLMNLNKAYVLPG